jgi:hypothetical protein
MLLLLLIQEIIILGLIINILYIIVKDNDVLKLTQ